MRAERREETAAALRERLAAADAGIEAPDDLWERVRTRREHTVAAPVPPPRRRALPFALVAVTAAAVSAVAGGTWWLVSPAAGPGPDSSAGPAEPPEGTITLRVHNVEKPCQDLHTLECSLRVAKNPYTPYADPGNAAGRVWHGDRLTATCVVPDGRLVTDEEGLTSKRWYRVEKAGKDGGRPVEGWLPGVRTRNTQEIGNCSASERPGRGGD